MAAELVRPEEEGEDEWERPLSDEELQAADVGKVFWNPEEEYAENAFVVQKALHRLPAKARVRPSKFAEYGFYYPSDDLSYKPFTFEGRRHMKRIYDTPAKRLLLICGRQVEKSTLIGNIALTYMCMVPGYRVLYVSPSATQTKTFSADRIREPLETSPVLKRFTTRMLSSNILEKQFVNRSRITLRYAYLNADRTRGIPAWQLSLDELQDILAENIPVIEQCLAHAPERWKRFIYSGTPKSLDNTIEYYRDRFSTQGEWVVPCDGCGSNAKGAGGRYWNVLGEKNIGRKSLICDRCGKEITPMHPDAQWARMVKEAAFESFHIPQLMVPWKPYSEILLDYERYPRDKFYNEVLGISFDGGLRPLTTGQVQANCNPDLHMVDYENYRQLSYSQPFFMGLDWGCHDEETRILTTTGFKYFRDLTDTDQVAQWEPDTRTMTFVTPKVRTVREWNKPLLHFQTRGGMDLMVTDTHRMRVRLQQGERWVTESAGETAARGGNAKFVGYVNWEGTERDYFVLPGSPVSPGYAGSETVTFKMDDWLEFLGYYLSEGGLCLKELKSGERRPYCIKMSQRETVNAPSAAKIADCMRRAGIPFSTFPNPKTGDVNWTICGKQYWSWFQDNVGLTGDIKRVPRQFLELGQRQLQILFEAMMLGDGNYDEREGCTGGAYYSTSKGLCEDFQEICIRLGLRCLVRLHKPADGNRKARWRALWSEGRDFQLNTPSSRVEQVPYDGKVYCCAVPSGYIVTERNGCIAYQGNTGENSYTVLTLATYINMRFRVIFAHRFTGQDTSPEIQLEKIMEIINYFNVAVVGTDYGGGFDRNDWLIRRLGNRRVWKYQYISRPKRKLEWDTKLGRFKVHRTEIMSDILNAIKRTSNKVFEFPRWEDFKDPFAQDMLNIYSEYNETLKLIQYQHSVDKPDDTFHSLLYCFLASMLVKPRPDVIIPRKEDKRGFGLQTYGSPGGTLDQG